MKGQMKTYKKTDAGEIMVHEEGMERVWVPSAQTRDPNAIALADLLSETEFLKDHGMLIMMLLPMEQLPEQHNEAKKFQDTFHKLHEQAMDTEPDPAMVRRLSDQVLPQAEEFHRFKEQLLADQEGGKIHTLMWPTLLDHLIREVEYFMDKQEMLMSGNLQIDREVVIDQWAEVMSDHADFIAHMLDPSEIELIAEASDASDEFLAILEAHEVEGKTDPVISSINDMVDFNMRLLSGIKNAEIQSIIPPELADHYRREALVFLHELMQADAAAGIETKAA